MNLQSALFLGITFFTAATSFIVLARAKFAKGAFLGIKKAKSLPNVKLPNINDFSSHKKLSAFIGTDPSV